MLDNEIMRLSENKFLIRSKSRADVETVVRNKYLKLFMAKSTNAQYGVVFYMKYYVVLYKRNTLALKDNVEYRNAIKDELRQANKRDRFLKYPELFKVVFLEAKELLPEEFTKEVKSFSQASEIFFSLDGNIRELILSKTEFLIDQIVERQIDEFISLKVRLEEKKEKIEQNMDKFINIIKPE